MLIQVLGPGCANCSLLAENAERAARESGIEYELEKVMDISRIISLGVIMIPALLIDGKCYCCGTVSTVARIKSMIQKAKEYS